MLDWVFTFLVLALISGLLGFSGIAIISVELARTIFMIFIILFVISLVMDLISRRS